MSALGTDKVLEVKRSFCADGNVVPVIDLNGIDVCAANDERNDAATRVGFTQQAAHAPPDVRSEFDRSHVEDAEGEPNRAMSTKLEALRLLLARGLDRLAADAQGRTAAQLLSASHAGSHTETTPRIVALLERQEQKPGEADGEAA